jgi:hypothetical protein
LAVAIEPRSRLRELGIDCFPSSPANATIELPGALQRGVPSAGYMRDRPRFSDKGGRKGTRREHYEVS